MKAMICRQWGGPEDLRLEEVERPALKAGQVRIRIKAAGVSFATTLVIAGKYQRKPPLPFAPGTEASGWSLPRTPTSISRPAIASSTRTFRSWRRASSMPTTSEASSSHFDTPTDEPRLAGLANDGKPSDSAASRARSASSSHS